MRGARGGRGRGGMLSARPGRGAVTATAHMRGALNKQATNAMKRLQRDYKELKEADIPLCGVSAAPLDSNLFVWHANLKGPEGSAYQGGVFHVEITFPESYPVSPPSIRLFTTVPHPNVFGSTLCLDMLQQKKADSEYYCWNSGYTVMSVLMQLQSFLFEVPAIFNDLNHVNYDRGSISAASFLASNQERNDHRNKYKKAIDEANAYKCDQCKHMGPIEPYPPFNENENEEDAFIMLKDKKTLLSEEFLCYHSKAKFPEAALGIGVSISRLPRTGEIRSVTPTLDLISLKAFTKQKIRKSIDNSSFTHWLPLFFGEKDIIKVVTPTYDEEEDKVVDKTHTIDPRERYLHLLKHSISFLTTGSTKKEVTPAKVLEVMPKLLITHLVRLADEKQHCSILAIRRLVNFFRLYRLLIELHPATLDSIDEQLHNFVSDSDKRHKDYTASLGDVLSNMTVSDKFTFEDLRDAYLEEQLDRQAFWIIQKIPELDHTNELYKNKSGVLEASRAEACFKTGLVGFRITMLFQTINAMFKSKFNGDWKAIEAALDDNFGCFSQEIEEDLQKKIKLINRVDTFEKYYGWVGVDCPDANALATRLRAAITNSKNKRYHGSSEHMNQIDPLKDQVREMLMSEPHPFKEVKKDAKDPYWKEACMKKFPWISREIQYGVDFKTAKEFAAAADESALNNTIQNKHSIQAATKNFADDISVNDTLYDDYADFTWKDLFHKLCFEQMLDNVTKANNHDKDARPHEQIDFTLVPEYCKHIGDQIRVLRIPVLNRAWLKSNHYWIMVLLTKLDKLESVIFENAASRPCSTDFFKFMLKGMNYIEKEGRSYKKIRFSNILQGSNASDLLYQCLKPHSSLTSINLSYQQLSGQDCKAFGKILSDFKGVKELTIKKCTVGTGIKDFADGLMRAKQIEILKLIDITDIKSNVHQVIYNLAFSPKIRIINLSGSASGNSQVAESLQKLVQISGAIECLDLQNTGIRQYLTVDFYKALGENKSLVTLNLDDTCSMPSHQELGKAVAFNAFKKGSLKVLGLEGGLPHLNAYMEFIQGMFISEVHHEERYGDPKLAKKMREENSEAREIKPYCNLSYLNINKCRLSGLRTHFKFQKYKTGELEWPKYFKLFGTSSMDLHLRSTTLTGKDMETLNYMLKNVDETSKMRKLDLSQNNIGKEGMKLLTPALETNPTLTHLSLAVCKLGVSGVKQIAEVLKTNTTIVSLNLFRNRADVDGARALGEALKVNSTLKTLDIGHNCIRFTGLKGIVSGIKSNATSSLTELGVCANFLTGDAVNHLFDELVVPGQSSTTLSKLYIKNNFLLDYMRVELGQKLEEHNLIGKVYVDALESVTLLEKQLCERSIWISPLAASTSLEKHMVERLFMERFDCGLVVDVRIRRGKKHSSRNRDNYFAVVEYAHVNSVPRSLKLASKKLVCFQGVSTRVYKAGTKTAIIFPKQGKGR